MGRGREWRWPNLYVIGAPRAGTTALHYYLGQHPQIFMASEKEPWFMDAPCGPYELEAQHERRSSTGVSTIDDYRRLFRHVRDEDLIGEATPGYLYSHRVPQRISHYAPDAAAVVILRSPAARMFSHYSMGVRDGRADTGFDEAVRSAVAERSSLFTDSLYAEGIARFQTGLGRDRVIVLLHDDLDRSPAAAMRALYASLGVDDGFSPATSLRPNQSGVPRSRLAARVTSLALGPRVMRAVHLYGPRGLGQRLDRARDWYFAHGLRQSRVSRADELAYNRRLFRDDIERTASLIGRDLGHWLT